MEHDLPPDLAAWKLIRRNGRIFAVSPRHGGSAVFADEPGALEKVIASAREQHRFAEAVDPVTGKRRED